MYSFVDKKYVYRIYSNTMVGKIIISILASVELDSLKFQEIKFLPLN